MKSEIINLNQLPLNEKGIIKEIKCTGTIKRRLLDLGLVKGTTIIPVLVSPSNDPRAFCLRGSTIAIRVEDAEHIDVIRSSSF
ncbi:MAG: ferrous iron transport protein A [Clostridia bacterium]|nr:ferrous iron transport protein A [Clostridia bacterium]